jgi:uncharacterized protein YbjT (DUF2867 family)
MVLITGAKGHLGKSTIDFLLKNGVSPNSISALARSEDKAAEFVPAGEAKINFVLRNEIAEALANLLTTSGHENKVYDIGTEEPISSSEIADYISEITGQKINYHSPEPEV